MPENENFRVVLSGPGIDVERDLTEGTAFDVLAVIMGKAAKATTPEAFDVQSTVGSSHRPTSLREFLSEVGPSTHVERIVTIGTYLDERKEMPSFSKADIEEGYRSARETMPANLSRDISKAVANGMLDDAGEKGKFHVTNSGASAVAAKFSN